MATSPRSELRVVSITEFNQSPKDNQWYWTTLAANGEPVGDGAQGYQELRKAVGGFFSQQGVDLKTVAPEDNPYSKLIKINPIEFHIRKYAYGAPDPFDPEDPGALAKTGYVPPEAEGATAK